MLQLKEALIGRHNIDNVSSKSRETIYIIWTVWYGDVKVLEYNKVTSVCSKKGSPIFIMNEKEYNKIVKDKFDISSHKLFVSTSLMNKEDVVKDLDRFNDFGDIVSYGFKEMY